MTLELKVEVLQWMERKEVYRFNADFLIVALFIFFIVALEAGKSSDPGNSGKGHRSLAGLSGLSGRVRTEVGHLGMVVRLRRLLEKWC